MIKMSKEFKVGIASLVVLILFYWGFNYLKGRNLLSAGSDNYYTTYENIGGLKKSSPVTISGFRVGSVIDIYFNNDPAKKGNLVVEFTVEEDITFSKNSIVKIYSGSIMGGKSLAIIPANDKELAVSGDFLKGEVEPDMFTKLDPLQTKVEGVIGNIDDVAMNVNGLMNEAVVSDLQSSIHNVNQIMETLKNTSKTIDAIVSKNNSNLETTLKNVEITSNNLRTLSDSLAKVKILAISKKINSTIANLDEVTSGIKSGKGTLGKLTKDAKLYDNLEAASKELEELLRDMKEHPKRFVHFSLFGKKEKEYQEKSNDKQ